MFAAPAHPQPLTLFFPFYRTPPRVREVTLREVVGRTYVGIEIAAAPFQFYSVGGES